MKDRNKPINDYCKISTLIKGRVLVNGAVVVQTAAGKWVDKPNLADCNLRIHHLNGWSAAFYRPAREDSASGLLS